MEVKIEKVKLSDLREYPNNPRIISQEQFEKLKQSLIDFPTMGLARELVINEDNVVLGGNQRLKALKDIGETEVVVKRVIGWTPEEQENFLILDNSPSGVSGSWDMDLLAKLNNEKLLDWGLDPNFSYDLIDDDEFMGRSKSGERQGDKPYNFRAELTKEQYERVMKVIDGMGIPPRNEGTTNRLGWGLVKLVEAYENGEH